MKIKVFTHNQNGKIEFTPAELEKLLNDTYTEGQHNCNCANSVISTSVNEDDACECANPARKPYTVTATFNATDAKEMSKHINEIIQNAAAKIDSDAFSKLAKELTF